MTLFIPLAAAVLASRTECLEPRRFTIPWRCWVLMKWLKASLKLVGSVSTLDDAEVNLSTMMSSEADVDGLQLL